MRSLKGTVEAMNMELAQLKESFSSLSVVRFNSAISACWRSQSQQGQRKGHWLSVIAL